MDQGEMAVVVAADENNSSVRLVQQKLLLQTRQGGTYPRVGWDWERTRGRWLWLLLLMRITRQYVLFSRSCCCRPAKEGLTKS
jgi:hypothetical protein